MRQASQEYNFRDFDENTPMAMCYTTATTGVPKGCVYTHRMQAIHALTAATMGGLTDKDAQLSLVPMFHMLGWGIPYMGTWQGQKHVMAGRHLLDAPGLCKLIEEEKVTFIGGVPVLLRAVLEELRTGKYDYSSLKTALNGGSSPDLSLIKGYEDLGIEFRHGYGMTETAPLITLCIIKGTLEDWPTEKKQELKRKQGLIPPCLEWKVLNEKGEEVKWDGKEIGQLVVRGPWVIEEYYKEPEKTAETFKEGWLYTRDMVTVDEEGYIYIVDRAGDLIKSGGEWISSLDLDDYMMRHPAVLEAATIGIPHPQWDERPLAFVVPRPEFKDKLTGEDIKRFLLDEVKAAKWWVPDDFIFVDEIPKTAAVKFDKKALREKYARKE
jgi:fatty-acyl-CoA synthase